MKGIGGRLAVAAVVVCWLAAPALADGLARFEAAIKQASPGVFKYKSAKALGENGFVVEEVTVTPPPEATQGTKTQPIDIKRIAVEDFDFSSLDNNTPPLFAKVRVEGLVVDAKQAEGVDLKELAGIDKVTADFQLDYRLDPDKKTMSLNRLELDLAGLARLEVSMIVDGISSDAVASPDAAMNDATLRTASLVFEDRALLGKVVAASAKLQGMVPAALVAMSKGALEALRDGAGPTTLAVLDALASFVEDYQHPKGPLRVTLNPPGKTSAAMLSGMATPDEAVKALGLVVSYSGTRPLGPPATKKP